MMHPDDHLWDYVGISEIVTLSRIILAAGRGGQEATAVFAIVCIAQFDPHHSSNCVGPIRSLHLLQKHVRLIETIASLSRIDEAGAQK